MRLKAFYRCYRPILLPRTAAFLALLELFGVVLEGLACFGVYRLMAAKSPKYAHRYHSGIFGYLMFCA